MKKCLFISYYFPPREGIGSQRPSKLAKYFPEFGWQPIVLTAKLPGEPQRGVRVIETDYKDVLSYTKSLLGFDQNRGIQAQLNIQSSKKAPSLTCKGKAIRFAKDLIAYPDDQRGWYRYAIRSARELLNKEKIDVILSTSSPVTSHMIARDLSKEYHIPWVADLRDLWTQNHFYRRIGLIRYFERRMELKTFRYADSLVTVTPEFADQLRSLHKDKKVYCITNGYDPEDFDIIPARLTDKFTLTYTGILYNGKRDPSLLLETVSSLINENKIDKKGIEVRFYGPRESWFIDAIRKYDMDDVVNIYGNVSRESALGKQKESQILLLLLDKNNREKDVYPAKIFEYFGARRPIIAFGGSGGAVKNLLEKTNAGEFAADKNDLKNILYQYYQQYVSFGRVNWINSNNVDDYTYKSITKKYADSIDEVLTKRP